MFSGKVASLGPGSIALSFPKTWTKEQIEKILKDEQSKYNYFAAMQYNHTMTPCAIDGGFGGGFSSLPVDYKDIQSTVSSEAYEQNVLMSDIDSRKVHHAWTPWLPYADKEPRRIEIKLN